MKICVCTIPIRKAPTKYPPFGCMEIIQSLRKIGKETVFYNIDYFRPSTEEIAAYFGGNKFDIVGISAVVSTAYSYTKYLSEIIKTVSPDSVIVVGGNLAASAEILLRKCEVDFCVIGHGELIIQELVTALEDPSWDYERMKEIQGICFLDSNNEFHFTGFREPPRADQMQLPDYTILESDGSLDYYIEDIPGWYVQYGLEIPPNMRGKKNAVVQIAKGCANRCTFCHRWEKGYRIRPLSKIKEHVEHLKSRYNVGFMSIADESFGTRLRLTWELAEYLGDMGIVWRANAVRARSIDRETLFHWKANGCVAVTFGIESGSQAILDVMEKNTTVQMNIDALKWCYEADLVTSVQLVLGMPGETDKTIQETIAFLKECMPYYPRAFRGYPNVVTSINYAQALPGSPLYEYARHCGLIGRKIDDEEKYLIRISDTDASETSHYVNCTKLPVLKVLMWRPYISGIIDAHHIKRSFGVSLSSIAVIYNLSFAILRMVLIRIGISAHSIRAPVEKELAKKVPALPRGSNLISDKVSPVAVLFLNPFSARWFFPFFQLSIETLRRAKSPWRAVTSLLEYFGWKLTNRFRRKQDIPARSLRKLFKIDPPASPSEGTDKMIPIRLGR